MTADSLVVTGPHLHQEPLGTLLVTPTGAAQDTLANLLAQVGSGGGGGGQYPIDIVACSVTSQSVVTSDLSARTIELSGPLSQSVQDGIVAIAQPPHDGNRYPPYTAPVLIAGINRVSSVPSQGMGVFLPPSFSAQGETCLVVNDAALPVQVWGQPVFETDDTVGGVAGPTGMPVPANASALFFCPRATEWAVLDASSTPDPLEVEYLTVTGNATISNTKIDYARISTAQVDTLLGVSLPLAFVLPGRPPGGAVLNLVLATACTLPSGFSGSQGFAGTVATAPATFTASKLPSDGSAPVPLGTVSFATNSRRASFAAPPVPADAAAQHQYWQILITGGQDTFTLYQMAEVQFRTVAGQALAFSGGTASASSDYNSYNDAAKATDGDPGTIWSSANKTPPNYWRYAYAAAPGIEVAEVLIQTRGDAGADGAPFAFDLQYSDDGAAWTTRRSFTAAPWTTLGQIQTFRVASPLPPVAFAPGDVLQLAAPSPSDATLADVGITFLAQRT